MRTLRSPQIQTIIKREGDDTSDQAEKAYVFLTEWIHGVAADSENTQSTMRRRQRHADPRAEAHLLCPFPESGKPLFRLPIGGMLWVAAAYSLPHRQLFDRQIRQRGDGSLTPNLGFDLLGILFQDNEVKAIKLQELTDFIREGAGQFLRFAAPNDRLTDAHNGLVTIGVALRRNDQVCPHSLTIQTPRHWPSIYTNSSGS